MPDSTVGKTDQQFEFDQARLVIELIRTTMSPRAQRALFEQLEEQGLLRQQGFKLLCLSGLAMVPGTITTFTPFLPLPATDAQEAVTNPMPDELSEGSGLYITSFLRKPQKGSQETLNGVPVIDSVGSIEALTLQELEVMAAGVRAGREMGYNERTPTARNSERNKAIVRLTDRCAKNVKLS